jgi:cardiolipin synthase
MARMSLLTIPNVLTIIRILTIPVFLVLLFADRYGAALIVFIFGGFTDFFDGLAARWMNQKTTLGAYLDPLADKLLILSSYVVFGLIEALPAWFVILVISRDILIVVGYGLIYLLVKRKLEVRPTVIGKWSTTLQLLTLGVALALLHDREIVPSVLREVLIGVTAIATVASGVQYLYRACVWLSGKGPALNSVG